MVVDPSDPSVRTEASLGANEDVIKTVQAEEDCNGEEVVATEVLGGGSGDEESDEEEDEDVEVTVRSRRRKVLPGLEEEEFDVVEEPEADDEDDNDDTEDIPRVASATEDKVVHEEEPTTPAPDTTEEVADPTAVPRRGPFFMHDTRSSHYAPSDDGTTESRPLWQEPADNKAWVHDKFSEITSEEYDPTQHQPSSFGGRRSGRGRGGKSSRNGRRRNAGRGRRGKKAPSADSDRKSEPVVALDDDPSSNQVTADAAHQSSAEQVNQPAAVARSPQGSQSQTPQHRSSKWGDDGYKGEGKSELASPTAAPATKRKKATIVTVARVTANDGTRSDRHEVSTKTPSKTSKGLQGETEKASSRSKASASQNRVGKKAGVRKAEALSKSGVAESGRVPRAAPSAVRPPAPGKVVRYSTQRKASGKAKAASTFVPSPSAVAAAYQPPMPVSIPGMYMAPGMSSPGESFPSSPVYYDQNGQPYLMSPTPMGYPSYGIDPGSPSTGMPMVMDQQGNPMMVDGHGNPIPMMDYGSMRPDPNQMYYPPPSMTGPPMTSPTTQNTGGHHAGGQHHGNG